MGAAPTPARMAPKREPSLRSPPSEVRAVAMVDLPANAADDLRTAHACIGRLTDGCVQVDAQRAEASRKYRIGASALAPREVQPEPGQVDPVVVGPVRAGLHGGTGQEQVDGRKPRRDRMTPGDRLHRCESMGCDPQHLRVHPEFGQEEHVRSLRCDDGQRTGEISRQSGEVVDRGQYYVVKMWI